MKSLNLVFFIVFPVLLSFSSSGLCQVTDSESDIDPQKMMNAAEEIMVAANTCALITLGDEGFPRARAMDPFAPESDFTVWFGTNPNSRKVFQIKKDPRVSLYYLANDASGYVTIHGVAHLVNDPQEIENRWKEEWAAFYPDRSKGYILIKVSPLWMEVVSYTHGITGDSVTWQPPILEFDRIK